jgi:hypothetical protein
MLPAPTVATLPARGFTIMPAQFRSASARHFLLAAAACAPALWFAAQPALAQSNRSAERNSEARHADQMREMEIKRLEDMRAVRPDNSQAARLLLEQIGDDFRRMQIANNEMMRATFADGAARALDYERISKTTAEINRRAARLRANLQLPSRARDDSRDAGNEITGEKEMRSSLLSLDELIMGFVNNPAFRERGVLDAQHSARASRDLAAIIKLSQKIKQRAEKLKG